MTLCILWIAVERFDAKTDGVGTGGITLNFLHRPRGEDRFLE
jgi:hypothetical protein